MSEDNYRGRRHNEEEEEYGGRSGGYRNEEPAYGRGGGEYGSRSGGYRTEESAYDRAGGEYDGEGRGRRTSGYGEDLPGEYGRGGPVYGEEGRRPHHGRTTYDEETPYGPGRTTGAYGEDDGIKNFTAATTAPGYSKATTFESGPGYQAATTYTAVVKGPVFTIRSKDDTSYAVSAEHNGLKLKPVDEDDRSQLWRLEINGKEDGKWHVLTLVNVGTNKAPHFVPDEEPVALGDPSRSRWSLGKDEGGHYFAIRPAGNKDINWDAYGGKAGNNVTVSMHEWKEGDNQMWGFFPKGSRKPVQPWETQTQIEGELDRVEKLGEAEHDYKQHKGESHALGLGAVTAGAVAAYEEHRAKDDSESAHRHKVEAQVAEVAMAGLGIGAAYEGYEAHGDKKDRKKYADDEDEEKKGWF